ncbi:MAG TPA: tetraacyldisaccharide 4'-kinase [Burkholderiales bacterium]|nr:tetraacyldisaccharide 4'-kinase [Burkholderiales bacterium]
MRAVRPTASDFAARHWYRLSPLSVVLFPLSLVFRLAVALRRLLFALGILESARLRIPVIVVGNLTVGGTGKTPLVLALAQGLRRHGLRPGILSRGYRGTGDSPRAVAAKDDPERVGDEPLLLAERSGCPVWIGADRVEAGRALCAANPECNVILCDDGLQHYRLQRDFEIAVEDERGAGNGLLLPAGPLREPADRRVDARVVNGGVNENEPAPGAFAMRLAVAGLYRVGDASAVAPSELAGKKLHAVAGIGNPARFFATLSGMGLVFSAHAFPDHHPFAAADLQFADSDAVLMTEKDAVKCRRFGRRDLVAVRVEAEVDPALMELILERIRGRAPA